MARFFSFVNGGPILLKRLLTPAEVANLLQVEVKTLAQWRSNGLVELPFVKLGSSVRYEESAVQAFIEAQRRRHTGDR